MRAATALAWLATLIYPLAIWLGLARFEPRWLGCVLLAVAQDGVVVSTTGVEAVFTSSFTGLVCKLPAVSSAAK